MIPLWPSIFLMGVCFVSGLAFGMRLERIVNEYTKLRGGR